MRKPYVEYRWGGCVDGVVYMYPRAVYNIVQRPTDLRACMAALGLTYGHIILGVKH
jgi:hypothetical protein